MFVIPIGWLTWKTGVMACLALLVFMLCFRYIMSLFFLILKIMKKIWPVFVIIAVAMLFYVEFTV